MSNGEIGILRIAAAQLPVGRARTTPRLFRLAQQIAKKIGWEWTEEQREGEQKLAQLIEESSLDAELPPPDLFRWRWEETWERRLKITVASERITRCVKEGKEGDIQREFIEALNAARRIEAGAYRIKALAPLRKQWKELLLACARRTEAVYQMCGLLAQVYPEQAREIARAVARPRVESHARAGG